MARDEDCLIQGLGGRRSNEVIYSCDTEGGSSGSPIISLVDMKVIAIHQGKSVGQSGKYGIRMDIILNQSKILK